MTRDHFQRPDPAPDGTTRRQPPKPTLTFPPEPGGLLAVFGKADSDSTPSWLAQRRQAALTHAANLGFPTTQDEEWRFTRIAPLLHLPLHPAAAPARRLTAGEIAPFTFGLEACRLVFVDGHFRAELSSLPAPGGDLQAVSLRTALAGKAPELERHLGRVAGDETMVFTALNTAFFQDGALVCAAPGKVIAQPVLMLFIATGGEAGATAHVRNLIVTGAGSEMKVLEAYVSLSDAPHFTNAVTELVLGAEARLDHCKIQEENQRAVHVAAVQAQQDRGSQWTSHSISTGARLARHQIQTCSAAKMPPAFSTAFTWSAASNWSITTPWWTTPSRAAKAMSSTTASCPGAPAACSTAKSLSARTPKRPTPNKPTATSSSPTTRLIDTKPQLEIFADDVKCTHGATVGQMDEEALFYLRSRGIGLEHARQIMVRAFASDVVDRIPLEPVRAHLNQMLTERFKDKP